MLDVMLLAGAVFAVLLGAAAMFALVALSCLAGALIAPFVIVAAKLFGLVRQAFHRRAQIRAPRLSAPVLQ